MIKNAIQEKYRIINGDFKPKKKKGKVRMIENGQDIVENNVIEGLQNAFDLCAFDELNDKIYIGEDKADAQRMQKIFDANNKGFTFVN